MKNMVKKVFYVMLVAAAMIIVSNGREVRAEKGMDDFLYDTGMPQEVIDELTENQKALICESVDANAEFSFYSSEGFCLDENEGMVQALNLSDSVLTLNLVAYKCILDIGEAYAIFPSFSWKINVEIVNDSFTFLLPDGWEAVVDEDYVYYNMRIHMGSDNWDIEPENLAFTGQTYKMPLNIDKEGIYEGNAVFYAEKKIPSASHKAIVQYVHDQSPDKDTSYGVSIGIFSISVTPQVNFLSVKNSYFSF